MALPDHSIATGVDYYLKSQDATVSLWPTLTRQPFIEGFDLRLDRHTVSTAPSNVWLVDDGSVKGVNRFVAALVREGYVRRNVKLFPGVIPIRVLHFARPVT